MTIRAISARTAVTPESVGRNFLREFGQQHPGYDTVLPHDQAAALLTRLSEKTTRRTHETADAAAKLLEEFRAGRHQNGHLDGEQPQAMTARPRTTRHAKSVKRRETVAPVQQTEPHTPMPAKPRLKMPSLSMLDVVYHTTIATAVYGLWFTLKEMGLAFAVPYTLVSLHALRMAKNPASRRTARAGLAAVVVLEVLTFFVHLVLFNLRTVQAAKSGTLPLMYWENIQGPWYIALVLAALFSAAGVYAVAVTFSLTSEKHASAEKEKADADYLKKRCSELEDFARRQRDEWLRVDGWSEVRRAKAEMNAKEAEKILEKCEN